MSIVNAFLPQRPAIIDVGANIGNHAIYWALTHEATVTAFEPYAPARALLGANIARNAIGHLVITQSQALGAAPGRAGPEPREGNLGATRMRSDPNGPIGVVALDTFRSARCDLLKVDVEGSEVAVLEGASELMNMLRPLVWVEALTATDGKAIRTLMRGHGYHTSMMLSPTIVLYLPSRRRLLCLIASPRAVLAYSRRTVGRMVRALRMLRRLAL